MELDDCAFPLLHGIEITDGRLDGRSSLRRAQAGQMAGRLAASLGDIARVRGTDMAVHSPTVHGPARTVSQVPSGQN